MRLPEMVFPDWLNPALGENTAAAMLRGLGSLTANWGELVATAQTTMSVYQEIPIDRVSDLYDDQHALPLIAAARILDSASQQPSGLPEEDRNELGLQAVVAFGMYANFPSARAVASRLSPVIRQQFPDAWVLIATSAPKLLGDALADASLPPLHRQYLQNLELFLNTGAPEHASAIRSLFRECLGNSQSAFTGALFRSCRICLEHIITLSVARTLHDLGLNMPENYVDRLLLADVHVFLPPQYKAIKDRNLLRSDGNAIVALPTSTGKTLLGEMCIVSAFDARPGLACYIAPYVALGTQVADVLEQHLPEPFRIHRFVGGYKSAEHINSDDYMEVVVATPERFDALMRFRPELRSALRCVVCDEAHLIENDTRGIRLEGLITRLKLMNRSDLNIRIVLLSAVVSNYRELQRWIGAPDDYVIVDTWKPTARRLAIWHQEGKLVWYQGDDPLRRAGITSRSALGFLELPWPEANIDATDHFGATRKFLPLVHLNVAYLSQYLLNRYDGPILMVCATKSSTREMADAMADRFPILDPIPDSISRLIYALENRFPYLLPMRPMLERGVAYHNSSVPHEIRNLIEQSAKRRDLKCISATTTLAEGVDLPFRFTILVDWLKWEGEKQQPISSLLFKNMAGRCGRAGVFTEGDTIVFDNPLGDTRFTAYPVRRRKQAEIFLADATAPLSSMLQQVSSTSQDDPHFSVLASQFLAAIPENSGDDNLVQHFAEETFAALRSGETTTSQSIIDTIVSSLLDETEGALAARNSPIALTAFGDNANKTGFSPYSCRRIRRFLSTFFAQDGRRSLGDFCAQALATLGDLPEQSNSNLRKTLTVSRSKFSVKPADFSSVLSAWLRGDPLQMIFARLPYVQNSSRRPTIDTWLMGLDEPSNWDTEFDKFVDFVSSVLEGFLPWILWSSEYITESIDIEVPDVDWQFWSELVERGVDTKWANEALKAGAQGGRVSAAIVGQNWPDDCISDSDPIGVTFLADPNLFNKIVETFQVAYAAVGDGSVTARDLQRLQSWVWNRAGLSLTTYY